MRVMIPIIAVQHESLQGLLMAQRGKCLLLLLMLHLRGDLHEVAEQLHKYYGLLLNEYLHLLQLLQLPQILLLPYER